MANYDITLRNDSGNELTFWGSKVGDNGELHNIGYESLDGIGEPERRTTSTVKSGADGGLVVATDQQYSPRTVSFDGFAFTESASQASEFTRQLQTVCPIREEVTLLVATPTGTVYGARGVVSTKKQKLVYSNGTAQVFDVDFDIICSDPFWQDYSTDHPNEVQINKVEEGGLRWLAAGLKWTGNGLAWSSGGDAPVAINRGAEIVYPIITIRGKTGNPVIGNLTTGESVRLPLSLTANDTLIIDMDAESITLNGGSLGGLVDTNDLWGLLPGNNMIQYSSDSSEDNALVTISWRDKYIEAV